MGCSVRRWRDTTNERIKNVQTTIEMILDAVILFGITDLVFIVL